MPAGRNLQVGFKKEDYSVWWRRGQGVVQFTIVPEFHQQASHQIGADVFLPVTGLLYAPDVGILLWECGLVFDDEKAPAACPR